MARDRKIEALAKVPLFTPLHRKDLARVASLADEVAFGPGDAIVSEGRAGWEFYVIAQGTAEVTRGGKWLAAIGPGSFFGELALLDPAPRVATVTAVSPLRAYVFNIEAFNSLLRDVPEVERAILRGTARRLRAAEESLA